MSTLIETDARSRVVIPGHMNQRFLLQENEDGSIRVTDNGKTGLFKRSGEWIEGELLEADPHLCGWVGGPQIGNHRVTSQAPAPTS